MWCSKCKNGSDSYIPYNNNCNQCGLHSEDVEAFSTKNPFPKSPMGMGNGKSKMKYVPDRELEDPTISNITPERVKDTVES